jgi:alanyl-tRNA synthetase
MLGNFSFGDYFKEEAIALAWQLLTDVWKLPADRLIVSVFKGEQGIPRDDEAYGVWRRFVAPDRIQELGADDNFWQMGDTGPCGRCSEIYYVRPGRDPVEIWNNVFMEFERSAGGVLTPLPAPSIDTGMGLERITSVIQQRESNYDTDLFTPFIAGIVEIAGVRYGASPESDVSIRVVADHARATTFLVADGVLPSNEWRGYVLRKIMRRAMRHGKHLGIAEPFLHRLVGVIDREMGHQYPEVRRSRETIERTILAEEHRFDAVLRDGLPRLEAEIAKAITTPERIVSGDAAFRLYDTFGIPYDFIEDTAATSNVGVDQQGFERAMEAQRIKARAQSAFAVGKKSEEFAISDERALADVGDEFDGYAATRVTGVPVVALFDHERRPIEALAEGASGYAALARTPFYVEAGGQVSDTGVIINDATGAVAAVEGLVRIRPGLPRVHRVRVTRGRLQSRDIVNAEVDVKLRDATRRNHTATHLLHAALRHVLGSHVKQAGSLVAPDRLRFDFVHFQPVTAEELQRLELFVNEQVVRNVPIDTQVRPTEEAIQSGAMALFGEKYGTNVRVVSVPGISMELCGGTHVAATGDIGLFVIVAESGVAAGVRRIEALTGLEAMAWAQTQRERLQDVASTLHTNEEQVVVAVERLVADVKRLQRDVAQLKTKVAMGGGGRAAGSDAVEIAGVKLARRRVTDLDKDGLRELADSIKSEIKSGIVVLASATDGKVQMVVAVTSDLTGRVKAGQIVKELAPIVGGGGGGRPDFAEAGGRQPERIDDMLAASEQIVARLLRS